MRVRSPTYPNIMTEFKNWRHGENGMEKELEAPLRRAISVLAQHGYHYAIIGGVALFAPAIAHLKIPSSSQLKLMA